MRTISICQDQKKLMAMRHFDFDLTDMDFVRYYVSRTGDRVNERPCLPYLTFTPCNEQEWYQTCLDIANPPDTVYHIRRAKMQDCWEIYCAYEMPALRKEAA
jgi:hypothetical protein